MPTYDYQCNSCGHAFELFQSINDAVKSKCPECGKRTLRRLFGTGGAVVFRGSGFYQTDYRSESYKKGAEAEKKGTADGKNSGGESAPGKSSEGAAKAKGKEKGKPSSPPGKNEN